MTSGMLAMTAVVLFACGSWAAAADWKVGLARADLTPAEPIWLFGHAGRNRPSQGVIHPLWAKALVVEDADGRRVALVAADLPGMQRDEVEQIARRIAEKTGIAREGFAINFSHTHNGPLLAGLLTPGYRALVEPPEHWKVIEAYTRRVQDAVVETVAAAVADLRPADLAAGEDSCSIRDDGLKPFTDETNRDRPFHDRVPVLRVRGADGALRAVVFGYGCHPQSAGYLIHGGYPGYAQIEIERRHPGVQAMFVMGCGALSVTSKGFAPEASAQDGKLLAEAVFRALDRPLQPVRAGRIVAAFDYVTLPFAQPATRETLEQRRREGIRGRFNQTRDEFLLEYAEKHGQMPTGYDAPLQVIRLGDDLTFVMLSGEIAEGYAYRLAAVEFPDRRLWVAGFSNDLFAYVPTERVLAAGGRVGGDSQLYWGWPSRWARGIEDRIVNRVKDLMRRAEPR